MSLSRYSGIPAASLCGHNVCPGHPSVKTPMQTSEEVILGFCYWWDIHIDVSVQWRDPWVKGFLYFPPLTLLTLHAGASTNAVAGYEVISAACQSWHFVKVLTWWPLCHSSLAGILLSHHPQELQRPFLESDCKGMKCSYVAQEAIMKISLVFSSL